MRRIGLPAISLAAVLALTLMAIAACGGAPASTPQVVVQTVEVTRLVPVTVTPEAPTATPPPMLAEDFESGAGEWYVASDASGSAKVAEGRLLLAVNDKNWTYYSGHPDLDYLNKPFDLTVTMTNEGDPRDAYGAVCFRFYDPNNWANVSVNGDGFVSLGEFLDGTFYVVIPWTKPEGAGRGPYVLRVVDSGRRVAAYLNGKLVFDLPFEDLRVGGVSFFAATYEETPTTWAFDDIQVREVAP